MPRYLVERHFSRVSDDEMVRLSTLSKRVAAEQFPDEITWEHSHVVVDDAGEVITYCVYGAPDEDTVRRHATLFGSHAIAKISEIAKDVTPADFPD